MSAIQNMSVLEDVHGVRLLGICAPPDTHLMDFVRILACKKYTKRKRMQNKNAAALAVVALSQSFPCDTNGPSGKSPLERDCVVGLRGLKLRARHAVLSNRSLLLPQHCRRGRHAKEVPTRRIRTCTAAVVRQSDQVSLNAAANHPERTCVRPPLERYCWSISGAEGAPRSCPAGSIAEVGLRWCGATPRNPNGGSRCQSLRRSDRRRQRQRSFQPQNYRDTLRAILRRTWLMPARSNRASSRCCDHPRGQRLKR